MWCFEIGPRETSDTEKEISRNCISALLNLTRCLLPNLETLHKSVSREEMYSL